MTPNVSQGLSPEEVAELQKLHRQGLSQKKIADLMHVNRSTVSRYITRLGATLQADASVPQIPTRVYDQSQQIMLLDRILTKAECILATLSENDPTGFRIFCEAVSTIVNTRAIVEGKQPTAGHDKPFNMTIRVDGASSVEIDEAINGDDLPELTEGEIVDELDLDKEAEPLAKEYDPLEGF